MGKYSYIKPAEAKESRVIRLHLRVDEDSRVLGETYAEATLTDESGAVVSSLVLSQEQVSSLNLQTIKEAMLSGLGAVFIPTADDTAEAEAIK